MRITVCFGVPYERWLCPMPNETARRVLRNTACLRIFYADATVHIASHAQTVSLCEHPALVLRGAASAHRRPVRPGIAHTESSAPLRTTHNSSCRQTVLSVYPGMNDTVSPTL
jgi:hypothetical protein